MSVPYTDDESSCEGIILENCTSETIIRRTPQGAARGIVESPFLDEEPIPRMGRILSPAKAYLDKSLS